MTSFNLKNKDTYVYTNKTASEVIKMVAEDFQLNVGELEDTATRSPAVWRTIKPCLTSSKTPWTKP